MDLFIGLVTLFLYFLKFLLLLIFYFIFLLFFIIFFLFSLFVCVYVYVSLCDLVCLGLLVTFVLGFCPFFSSVFFL